MNREEAIKKLQKQKAEYLDEWVDYSGISEAYDMAIEALSADVVPIHEDGTLEVKVPNAQKVGRVLVMDTDSHIGGGLFYPEEAEAVQEWIPCSERLPNKEGYYLITSETGAVTTAHWYMPSEWKPDGFWGRVGKKKTVAWMEKPEPYKAESEE